METALNAKVGILRGCESMRMMAVPVVNRRGSTKLLWLRRLVIYNWLTLAAQKKSVIELWLAVETLLQHITQETIVAVAITACED